ncbi:hypothetical protein PLANPX_0453 [Lacipirellula parvula]|uniref:Uncharacterized protein n=1 Tax=Lacipirellula parvula TaxID=2650471 RepID=A0A5K7X7X0_9BACT|nr:hypothetical protein PLANPX_0453 [Lacipirellula parvula]
MRGMRIRFNVRWLLLLMAIAACFLTLNVLADRWFSKPFRDFYFPQKPAAGASVP